MQNIREKLKRKLSLHDKAANPDDYDDAEDVDEETTGHLHREIEKAEAANEPYGRQGSFLNKLIMHGNKKTADQLVSEGKLNQSTVDQLVSEGKLKDENAKPMTTRTT